MPPFDTPIPTALGLRLPPRLTHDIERNFLVKRFVDGEVADRWDADEAALDAAVAQLFVMSRRLKAAGLNIDWFPANFVVQAGQVHYNDYETNPYDAQWGLERWGLYYWANRAGMAAYARSGDWRHINLSASSGRPIEAPFEARVDGWRQRHGAAA